MRLYHTSTVVVERPDIYHSREYLDFGKGFYLTSLPEQAEKYGQRYLRYFSGIYNREQALDQLKYKRPNHQICITNQRLLDEHLHFIKAVKL